MKAFTALITALSIPLMVLNLLGGIVSGIWLVVLGEWGALVWGILFFFVSTGLLGIALMPSMLFAPAAANCAERGNTVGLVFFSALSNIYTLGLITIWCCGVFFLLFKDATASSLIPRLIWSYGVATGPWAYMASKDEDPNSTSGIATFMAELAYVVIILLMLFSPLTPLGAVKVFAGFMAVWLILKMTFVVMTQKQEQEFLYRSAGLPEPNSSGTLSPSGRQRALHENIMRPGSPSSRRAGQRTFTVHFRDGSSSDWVDAKQVIQWFTDGKIDLATWVFPSDTRDWVRVGEAIDTLPGIGLGVATPPGPAIKTTQRLGQSSAATSARVTAQPVKSKPTPIRPVGRISSELQGLESYELMAELKSGKLGPDAEAEILEELANRGIDVAG